MTRRLLLLGLLVLVGCSAPLVSHPPAGPRGCADKLAQALSSPNAPVPGAYACLSPDLMAAAQSSGVNSDADLQKFAASDPAFTSYRYLTTTAVGAYVYELDGPTAAQIIAISVDKHGLVVSIGSMAPEPMPTP